MRVKIRYFSVIIAALLIVSIFPNTLSISTTIENKTFHSNLSQENRELDNNPVMFNVYHIKGDGRCQVSKKSLSTSEINSLKEEMKNKAADDATLSELYKEKFDILKRHNIISDELTIEDIINPELFDADFDVIMGEDFNATTAPLFFFGGGIGVGLGVPFFITAGTFLVALFGFGLTLCYDIHSKNLYTLLTFTFIPILIGILNGFVGLLMLPVIPGFFYSNFLALGVVAKTTWIQLGL